VPLYRRLGGAGSAGHLRRRRWSVLARASAGFRRRSRCRRRRGRGHWGRDRSPDRGRQRLMAVGHAHVLYLDGDSPLHRAAPQVKIASMVLFTIVVVITPREEFWAFAGYTAIVAAVMGLARVRPGWLLTRTL